HVVGPLGVVDQAGGVIAVEVDEAAELVGDALGPLGDGVGGVHGALPHVTGIADHAGGTAGEHDGVVAGLLETTQHEQRDEVSGVQGGPGRVETAVQGDRFLGGLTQGVDIGGLVDQSAPAELVNDIGGHDGVGCVFLV